MSTYSRPALVSAITDYYKFLEKLYLPTGSVKYAPEDGWPGINSERLASCNVDDIVLDLLRHIPYIEERSNTDRDPDLPEIAVECVCNNYIGLFDPETMLLHESVVGEDCLIQKLNNPPHPHIVALGRARASDNGYWIFCDTQDGELILYDFVAGKCFSSKDPNEFFGELKEKFTTLQYIPCGPYEVEVAHPEDTEATEVQDVYRQFGWPSDDYRKDECVAEVQRVCERQMSE